MLDAGCGAGGSLNEWLASGFVRRGIGIDLFPEALARVDKSARASWAVASVAALPFRPRSFDLIHSADVLQHVSLSECEQALNGFADLLKPEGLLILRLLAPRLLRPEPDLDFSHSFPASRLKPALEGRNFEILFLSRLNMLPSAWAEILSLAPSKPAPTAVKHIHARPRPVWETGGMEASRLQRQSSRSAALL